MYLLGGRNAERSASCRLSMQQSAGSISLIGRMSQYPIRKAGRMTYQLPVNRNEMRQRLINNREEIKNVLQQDPALAEYLLGDVELKRKYVKLPDQVENQLVQTSHQLGVAEGVLLGLGAALLLLLLAEALKGGE